MAVVTAIFTVTLRKHIALLYNDNPEVVALAAQLMLLAAVYQISDSIQVIGSGILRGYKDTRSIFFITFTAYWVLGLPSGYILALTDGGGSYGTGRLLDGVHHRPDLGGGVNDATDALSTTSAVRHHFAARCAIIRR